MENSESNTKKIPIPKLKRLFDIIFSLVLLILLLPLFTLFLLLIFIEHIFRGDIFTPLFYIEKRISQGEEFNFIKFNIFKPEVISMFRKERIFIHTKPLEHDGKSLIYVGRVMQKIYLDELPQLLNVLKGDMSMVGPRPVNREVYKKLLDLGIATKSVIKTGLTGPTQSVKGLSRESHNKLETEYIEYCLKNPSWKVVINDTKIIFRTLIVVFRAQGI